MPFINISSAARSSGTDTDFIIGVDAQLRYYKYARLKQATFYRTMYNVTDDTGQAPANNKLRIVVSNDPTSLPSWVTLTIELPAGNYTISEMTAALKTAIDAALVSESITSVSTVTASTLTSKITISLTNSYQISVRETALLSPNQGLNLILGFSRFNATAFGASITAPRVYNMSRYLNLYIIAMFMKQRSYCTLGAPNLTEAQRGTLLPLVGSIPINAEYGGIIDFQETLSSFMEVNPNISQLQIRVIDDQGYPVDLNGTVLNLVVEVQ